MEREDVPAEWLLTASAHGFGQEMAEPARGHSGDQRSPTMLAAWAKATRKRSTEKRRDRSLLELK